jgi:hypothetical protein
MPATWWIPVTSFCPSPPIPPRPSGWPNISPTTIKGRAPLKWPCLCIHPLSAVAPLKMWKKAVAAGLKIEIVEVVEHGKDLDNTAMLQRLKSKGVQYVIGQTIQSPVATMLKDASRLGLVATTFGEKGKITFTGMSLHRRQRPGVPGRTGCGKLLLDDLLHCNVRARCGNGCPAGPGKKIRT